ncbi:MAG TPA: adenosylcobinamide-phosphate synthase CbiB [Ktedonobacteraceae bacterium]|jgi:adenosylcobinamide-phosphate synthase|nr:adenosylcobinamide-phosphate synthase CbiB [Ktedonobacteraceae bacterium]
MNHKKQIRTFALASGLAIFVAFALDLLGEPPSAWHPVVWYGKLIKALEQAAPQKPASQFFYGILMLTLAAPIALLPASIIHLLTKRSYIMAIRRSNRVSGVITYILLEGIALKPFFALRMLAEAGKRVRVALEQEKLEVARQELAALVSRDRSQLTAELVSAAAIESLAENLSDSFVAPLFYYLLFGLPGAATYRLFNTFDSMLGYHGQYEYLGKAAARLDDLLNLLPSRLTALLIIASAPLFGGQREHAWRIWRRDARKTASPNAGHPMAAAAGALGVQLEKVGYYTLGNKQKTITAHDIQRAERMVWWIGGATLVLTGLLKMFWSNCDE